MRDVLLEYVMRIDALTPLPAASTAYLRKVLCVVKPSSGVETGTITECLTKESVQALTQSNCWKLLDAGMNSIYVLPADDLNLADILHETKFKFFTVLIDGAFDAEALDDLDQGTFEGVIGWTNNDRDECKAFAQAKNNVAIYDTPENGSQNMYWAFGKLLGSVNWKNQQYIEMPLSSGIDTINEANLLFEDKISFVLTSEEYGNRLALFASNRKAIVAPYIFEEIQINLQSKALQYINLNQPAYTEKQASLLEDTLQGMLDEKYVNREIIESASVKVTLENENFVATSQIKVAEPKALWRINATLQQGDI